MGKRDPRITSYIAKQRDFARPILAHLRDVIHEGCPEVVETLKWSSPSFEYHGILCGFAYQGLVIWKRRLGDAITAHAITNFSLGVWVVWKGAWQFW